MTLLRAQLPRPPPHVYHHPEGPLSEAGRGEDLVVSVAIERGVLLLALLDLGECLIVRLAQPLDHGRDSACAVRHLGAQCRAGAVPGGGEVWAVACEESALCGEKVGVGAWVEVGRQRA